MALSKLAANSFDLTDNYALTGTVTGVTSTQKLFLIKNIDASSSVTISFVNGASSVVLDGTYKTYLFRYFNIHPATDTAYLSFQTSTNSGSSYGVTVTSSSFVTLHNEADNDTHLGYSTSRDLAQSTNFLASTDGYGNDNDQCGAGELFLFNPSNTTFVKNWIWKDTAYNSNNFTTNSFNAGYFNTTSAINAVQFKFSSGNIDSGRIALYGIK